MNLKAIGCKVLLRETCSFVAQSEHTIDLEFFGFALHDDPAAMRVEVQKRIDAAEGEGYDAILLVAGLCGHGSAGLKARSIPLVIPRVDDCIVLLMGSRERYDADHGANPGSYYLTPGWLERSDGEEKGLGEEARRRIRLQYVERFGEENADYLMSVLHSWEGSYSRACLIDTGVVTKGRRARCRRQARRIAESYGWRSEELRGDTHLIRDLLEGSWPEGEFLVVPPGASIQPSNDGRVVTIGEIDA